MKDAATLLFFKNQTELLSFAKEVGLASILCVCIFTISQRGWQIDLVGATIHFTKKGEEKIEIPKEKLISQNLAYARELEQII